MKKIIIGGIVLVLIAVVATVVYTKQSDTSPIAEVLGEPTVTIVRTDAGYEPKEVTIKKGDIVLWKNESGDYHWPASDLHPTHAIYSAFDPLKPIAPGADWKFRFDQAGVWKFHDHIRANKVGTVIVTE